MFKHEKPIQKPKDLTNWVTFQLLSSFSTMIFKLVFIVMVNCKFLTIHFFFKNFHLIDNLSVSIIFDWKVVGFFEYFDGFSQNHKF
jgi:hypothetical protein